MDMVHTLMLFGLTHQEARIYTCLYGQHQTTGYELAKETGISRSNIYTALASLEEKGAVLKIDGKPVRYKAMPVAEFCGNVIRGLTKAQKDLEDYLPAAKETEGGYLTIKGSKNIQNKIETMIANTQYRIYLSMSGRLLVSFLSPLQCLAKSGRKVVVITDEAIDLQQCIVYLTPPQKDTIRLISDSAMALTGNLDETPNCACLYSLRENLVTLLKDSIRNEIRLIELTGGVQL